MICISCNYSNSIAQELPFFKAIDKNGATIISWEKSSETLTLLVIQKSVDSLNGFKSIASMPDPNTPKNGFVDKSNKNRNHFYRIFFVGTSGKYYFTPSQKATAEIIQSPEKRIEKISISPSAVEIKTAMPEYPPTPIPNYPDTVEIVSKKKLIESALLPKNDSISTRFTIKIFTEKIGPVNNLSPNPFLFVNKENNLMLVLPETNKRKFHLQVWREDGKNIFKMTNIKESQLLIDKSNFIYSGWFRYEISEGDHIKEKGKFFINPE